MIVLGMIRQHITKIIVLHPPKLSPRGDSCNGGLFLQGRVGNTEPAETSVFSAPQGNHFLKIRGDKNWIQMFFMRFFWGLVSV